MHEFTKRRMRDLLIHLLTWTLMFLAYCSFFMLYRIPSIETGIKGYTNQTPLCIGGRDQSSGGKEFHERDFILFPSVFYDPKVVSVEVNGNGPAAISTDRAGPVAFIVLCIVLVAIYFRWRWRRWAQNDS